MKNFEKNLNDRFSSEKLTDETFNSESLWDNIDAGLNKDKSKKRRYLLPFRFFLWSFLAFFLIVGSTLIYLKFNEQETKSGASETVLIEQINKEQVNIEKTNAETKIFNDYIISNEKNSPSDQGSETNQVKVLSSKKLAIDLFSSKTKISNENTSSNLSVTQNLAQDSKNSFEKQIQIKEVFESELVNSKKESNDFKVAQRHDMHLANNKNLERSILNRINQSEFSLKLETFPNAISFIPENLHNVSKDIYILLKENLKESKNENINYKIEVVPFLSVNRTFFNYSSENENPFLAVKKNASFGDFGYLLGVESNLIINNNWIVGTGIEYSNLNSVFNYQNISTSKFLLEDELLHVWINSETKDTIRELRGDTLVNQTITRTVLHHNNFKQWTIPVQLGWKNENANWGYGFKLGAEINLVSYQSGKELNMDKEVYAFENSGPLNKTNIGLRINPFVTHKLSPAVKVNVGANWSFSQHLFDVDRKVSLHMHQVGLKVGLSYQL